MDDGYQNARHDASRRQFVFRDSKGDQPDRGRDLGNMTLGESRYVDGTEVHSVYVKERQSVKVEVEVVKRR